MNVCKGETFPKKYPYFILHKEAILKQKNFLRLGKISLDTGKERFIVEDQFSATRYEDYGCALKHFEENIKIDEEMRKG